MNKIYMRGGLIALLLLLIFTLWSDTCEPNYTCPYFAFTDGAIQGNSTSTHFNTKLTVGQPFINAATNYSSFSTVTGFWSFYMKEPRPPIVRASDGDFQDMVLVEWTIENDRTGPPVTGNEVQLIRNGYPYTTLPISQTAYQDLSVFPGEYYEYGVVSSNDMGTSHTAVNIGFVNPNGVITGNIQTPSGNPIQDAKVTLTPNLGRSALFSPGEEAYIYYIDPQTSVNRLFSGLEENYTIETWFKSIHTDHVQTLFSAVESLSADHYLKLEIIEGGFLRWQHNPSAGITGTELVTVNPYSGFDEYGNAHWHHVSCVFDSLNMTMYVDGYIVGEAIAGDYIENQPEIIIGKSAPADNRNYFYGLMDDFRIWSIAREWEDLRKYRDITLSGDEEGLAAYWKFDEVEGDIIFDLTENDNDGEICHIQRSSSLAPVYVGAVTDQNGNYVIRSIYFGNGTTFTVTPSMQTNIGRAVELNGIDQYISFNGIRLDLTFNFTLEGWFKTPETRAQMIFAASEPDTDQAVLRIEMTEEGFVGCSRFDTVLQNNANLADNLWHHYAVSYSAQTELLSLYIDGELIGTQNDTNNVGSLSNLVMGRSLPEDDDLYFKGRIDEVRLWNVCRNYDQINGTIMLPLEGDEYGLENYWKMNEGTDLLITDATGNLATGTLENGGQWSEDIPLYEMFDHYYEPESRQASLNHSNTAIDLINFTDVSMIPVSGYIRYESSACFLEGAQILVNNQQLIPPIYTDADGKWTVELEPGSIGDIISPICDDHQFTPPFIELPMITSPRTGLYFSDQELREISGIVAGGSCEYPITPSQGQIEVTVRAVNGCIEKTISPDAATGYYEIGDLPPLIYQIWMHHPNPNIDSFFTADTLSLESEDREFNFIYYAPPEIIINGVPPAGNITLPDQSVISDAGLMAQNGIYDIDIEIREAYPSWLNGENIINYCDVDSGEVYIIDHVNYDVDTTYTFTDGSIGYTVIAKLPNILGGGAHPYQKELTVIATDQYDRQASATEWIIITGNRPRNTTFTTTTPELPLKILRDPPGDGSSCYLSNTEEHSMSVGFSTIFSSNTSVFAALHLGIDVTVSTGQFVFTDFMIDTTLDITATASVGITNTDTYEQTWTLSTTETISTSENDDFVGDDGDIYMGAAINLLYGVTDILNIEEGILLLSEDMIIAPSGFATNFLYSEYHIINTLIPSLYDIGDFESAERWQSFLDMNQELKDSATLIANRSFDAGAIYEYSETSQTTESYAIGFELEIETEIATELGILVNGVGFSGGVMINTQLTVGSSYTNTATHSNTVGYTLTDNDIGDFFTVDIKWDDVYGTPVFDLVSGASSCPWEEETLKRNLPYLAISPSAQINIPPDEPAIYTMQLGNLSESEEEREYLFNIVNSTNPCGAQISVNGIYIENYLSYTVPYGQVIENTLSIERGPEAYLYENLQFRFYPPGDETLEASATVSVEFQQAASEVHIAVPDDNWLVNSAHGSDTLWVTIDGYNRLAENLESIDLRYRRVTPAREEDYDSEKLSLSLNGNAISENPVNSKKDSANRQKNSLNRDREWFTAFSVLKEDITEDYFLMPWNISPAVIIDGDYELRAVTVSTGDTGNGYSNIVPGLIDRIGPLVFGNPEPADGVLGSDDNIAVHFNENINGSLINPGNQDITLNNTTTGQLIDFTFTYGFNTITIEPQVNNQWIENQTLRVDINALEDMHGNSINETVSWEFFVNRNPIGWTGESINTVIYVDEVFAAGRILRNTGGSNRSFEIIGGRDNGMPSGNPLPIPDWLVISPLEGILAPGENLSINFNLTDNAITGDFSTTIFASGIMGDEPLQINVRILDYPPDWTVNYADYEYSMNMTTELFVNGYLSQDIYDRICVYVADEIRGVSEIEYLPNLTNQYQAFITIYSNVMAGEILQFRVWDASESTVLANIEEEYEFVANSVLGNPGAPVSLTAANDIIKEMCLSHGWNWISFNLLCPDMAINQFLNSLSPATNDIIKTQDSFAQYVQEYGWIGNLMEINSNSMYLMKLAEADTLEIIGYPVNVETDTIFVSEGWNWISYLPQYSMELNYALNSLEGLATGDIIKSQTSFAQYLENQGWFGNMHFMVPGNGYLIRLTYPGEIVYPFAPVPQTSTLSEKLICLNSEVYSRTNLNAPDWQTYPNLYEYNMNLIAIVRDNGFETASQDDLIAAFFQDECRGVNAPVYLPQYDRFIFFLTIYGNAEPEELELVYYNSQSENISNLEESITFTRNVVLGSIIEPFIFNSSMTDEIDDTVPILETRLQALYPNPFNPELVISYSLKDNAPVEIVVYNIKGQKVATLVDQQQQCGYYHLSWMGTNDKFIPVASGVYFISIKANEYKEMRKVLLMK
jgi:hypothetical protein